MTNSSYNQHAQRYFNQYQSLTFDQVHGDGLFQLDGKTGLALDVGAGSGRDAAALADRGWGLVAVEPAAGWRSGWGYDSGKRVPENRMSLLIRKQNALPI
jgi:hypothetical protein